jgi:hypothetical protein
VTIDYSIIRKALGWLSAIFGTESPSTPEDDALADEILAYLTKKEAEGWQPAINPSTPELWRVCLMLEKRGYLDREPGGVFRLKYRRSKRTQNTYGDSTY